ncbi:hypothetical protein KKB69_00420 [Patescibacteria group bacterium]|nr:hypothetical protein [Patescibacteria group bacterium]
MMRNIISLLFIGAAIAMFLTWTNPYLKEIEELRGQRLAFNEILDTSRQLVELRDNLLSKFNLITADELSKFSKIIPEKSESINFVFQLSNVAEAKGVIIKNINFYEAVSADSSSSSVDSDYKKLNIDAFFLGSYEGFKALVEEIENSLRLVDINKIIFSADKENLYEFTIKATAYFKK